MMELLFLLVFGGPIAAGLFWLVWKAGRDSMLQEIRRQEDENRAEADRIIRDGITVDDATDRLSDGRF